MRITRVQLGRIIREEVQQLREAGARGTRKEAEKAGWGPRSPGPRRPKSVDDRSSSQEQSWDDIKAKLEDAIGAVNWVSRTVREVAEYHEGLRAANLNEHASKLNQARQILEQVADALEDA